MMGTFQVIGKSVAKVDAVDKATGCAKFGADIHLPGMLKGKILHSLYPHARIVRIDTSRAEKVSGVKAVITGEETGNVRVGRFVRDRTILAWEKVRHIGEAVAAVAAVDEDAASEAIELIQVEYEELPSVFDPFEALKPEAPIVHEELSAYFSPVTICRSGNILHQIHIGESNMEEAWAQADIIHEESYSTQAVHHGFIQPHEVVSQIDGSGNVILWSSTKSIFGIRRNVCEALELPMSHLRVIGATVGGDFGGKGGPYLEPICVLLARKANAPVSLSLSREEEFICTFLRERGILRLKLAAKKDGTLLGLQSRIILDIGAYCDTQPWRSSSGSFIVGPYRIPNVDLDIHYVYTNNHPTGHVRAPMSITQQVFAIESHLDGLAKKLGIDPIEIRWKNKLKDGDHLPGSGTLRNVSLGQTIGAAAESLQSASLGQTIEVGAENFHKKKTKEKNRGWGIACGHYCTNLFQDFPFLSNACVRVNEDGTVILMTGISESGGGQHTILAQIVAEVLKIPYERVKVVFGDTDVVPRDWGTSASQTNYRAGMMVRMAAEDVREQILQLGAERLGMGLESLELADGRVFVRDKPSVGVPIVALTSPQGAIQGTGSALRAKKIALLNEEKEIVDGPSSCVHAAEVEVDPDTGKITVLRYFAVHDVGFALNPKTVEGQIEGGIAQGLGYALSEEAISASGRIVNPTLTDYKLPTASDVPKITTTIIEVPSGHGPFGAKGFAEASAFLVAPAIANAVFDATGVRITDLPITPEKVLRMMKAKKKID